MAGHQARTTGDCGPPLLRVGGSAPGPPPWPSVDRPAVRRALTSALRRSRIVVVTGPPGSGKSRLVSDQVDGPGSARLVGTPSHPTVPGAAVAAFVHRGATAATPLSGLVEATSQRLSREGIALLVVDDSPDLDDVSAVVLHQCVESAALRLVLVRRTGDALPAPLASLAHREDAAWVTVPPASDDEVAALVHRALHPAVDPGTVEHLRRSSEGNLLYLRHLVEGSVSSGALALDDGVWRFLREPDATPLLEDVLRGAFAALPSPARELADLLALAGPLSRVCVEALAPGTAAEQLEASALAHVTDAGTDPGDLVLGHPLYRDHLLADLTATRRRRLVLRLLAFEETRGPDPARDLRIVVWRHECGLACDPDADLDAAGTALADRRPELAAALLTRATGTADTRWPRRGTALLLAARCREQTGHADDATDLYRALLADTGAPSHVRAVAASRLAECLRGPGADPAGARALLDRVSATLTDGPDRDLLRCQVALGLSFDGDLPGAARLTAEVRTVRAGGAGGTVRAGGTGGSGADDDEVPPDVAVSAAVVDAARLLHEDRPLEVVELVARSAVDAAGVDSLVATAPATLELSRAHALARLGRTAEADAAVDAMADHDLVYRSTIAGAFVDSTRGTVALFTDRPAEAEAAFVRGASRFRDVHLPGHAEWADVEGLLAATDLVAPGVGVPGLRDRLARIEDDRRPGFGLFSPELLRARARILALSGDAAAARATWCEAARLATGRHAWLSAVESVLDLICAGEIAAARDAAAALPAPGSPSAEAALVVVGTTARGGGGADPDTLGAVAEGLAPARPVRAADLHALAARTLVARGESPAGPVVRAHELARSVPGLRRPHGWLPSTLSAREEEVALLAAEGLTNAVIAARLGLVAKTVENHLGHAYRALGVSRRTELAEALGLGG